MAPLIGFAFRAIFGNPHTSLHMVGDPGSGKTSITRCAGMHWFASSMQENGGGARKEVFSALDDTGESIKGLLNKMHQAADVPITVDDFKGPKGPVKLAPLQSAAVAPWQLGPAATSPTAHLAVQSSPLARPRAPGLRQLAP